MKKEINSFNFRFVAFVVLLAFTAMSCSLLGLEEPEESPDDPPVKPLPPTMFYLTADNEISEVDTGRMGFAVNEGSSYDLFDIAEELQDGRIAVHFIITKNETVSLYFSNLTASFPSEITMDLNMTGTFNAYDKKTQTFSLILSLGGLTAPPLEGLDLNKGGLTMYQDEPLYSPSLNARIRDYLIAKAVWKVVYLRIYGELSI
jgi:hypothetical protein